MRHLTEDQTTYIFKARLDTPRPMTWKQVSEELDITPSRLRSDRQTKTYAELAFAYCARYGYGTGNWTLRQAGCLHPDIDTMKMTWDRKLKRRQMKDSGMVYDNGGRTGFDLHRGTPVEPVGDCVIRAIAIALNADYGEVWTALNTEQEKRYGHNVDEGVHSQISYPYLTEKGWLRLTLTRPQDAREIAAKLPGEQAILCQPLHFVASVNGVCHDTWNSSISESKVLPEDTTWRYGNVTENGDGTITVDYDARVTAVYVAAERMPDVEWALRENLPPERFPVLKLTKKVEDRLPLDCEVKRYSDAYERLMDEAIERVMEDANPEEEGFDDYFSDYVEEAMDALLAERNVTLI